ncbi:M20 family metallopeptidase [Bacillus sp. DTU_2020_1000418_1_SI_GHA_SEK_038]|uniref:M20 family metallopeptidase n=1 Tax=Bacillus sp. DTU_2020_1000418_1_SI_GHA_SEK_038 TaxID=3077585 RepID=UPI0028EC3555|nr:M20 family metallopeptidase [Bacillus sp. DTU_2020_1000418_1_SI_GHA_SEK_038]WNS75463.1 M20 family metallopeptidase [Bacillus sp. DTU_2020_1000418_1_SI_GHA_SEK_038]
MNKEHNALFNVTDFLQEKKIALTTISDKIWAKPELHFKEKYAVSVMEEALKAQGFAVEKNVANLETAIMGSFGSGSTVIAFLGEYDALPFLSQEGGKAEYSPVEENGNGHGCGHNLLGTGALAAAVAAKEYVEKTNAPFTIRFYGCPAEENGSGKAYMAKHGVFNDVDMAISWHPMSNNTTMNMTSLANYAATFKFTGKSAHAAAAPHLGRSALDAVELMNVGVNYLREHIIQEARIHYAVVNSGGTSPNVVQPYAEVSYLIRAPKKQQVVDIHKRVQKIAQGAALMTETTFEEHFEGAASDLIPNTTLAKVMQQQFDEAPALQFSEEDFAFAEQIYQSLDDESKALAYMNMSSEQKELIGSKHLCEFVSPLSPEMMLYGSTDVADVSWITPTVQCTTACFVLGTPLHTWQVVAVGNTPIGHKGMLYAADIMARTAITCIENPTIIEEAKQELKARLKDEKYMSLIPEK